MKLDIITNRHWREFIYRCDVPESVLADQFDYLDEETPDGFIHYRGSWYHINEFTNCSIDGWHGQRSDSFFSAVLIRLSDDGEQYQIALALS